MASLAIIPLTVVGVLVIYWLSRAAMGQSVTPETKELASSVGFRIAGFHGLIIALVFTQLALVYRNLENDLAQEAQVIHTIYTDAKRHGGQGSQEIMDAARKYVAVVLSKDLADQAAGRETSVEGQRLVDRIFELSLALPETTPTEQALRDALIADVRRLNDLRAERQGFTQIKNGGPFWFAAVAGLALLAACFAPFEPTRRNLALILGFALYSGLIFMLIHSYQNPFKPPGEILPTSFERVRESMR